MSAVEARPAGVFAARRSTIDLLVGWLSEHRYFLLCLPVLGVVLARALSQPWESDFYEHSAVVRELATHPFAPRHPILLLDAPHAFASPYALAVAWLARLGGLSAMQALGVAAVVNAALLLFALGRFVRLLTGRPQAAFYTLLFTELLWGIAPWPYSGFLHLRALGDVAGYPSTFAAALTFVGLALGYTYLRQGLPWGWARLLCIALISCVVLLTHAMTAAFLCIGFAAIAVGSYGRERLRHCLMLLAAAALGGCAALLWPYYPLLALLTTDSRVFHATNLSVYDDPLQRTFPALLGVPFVVARLRRCWRDPLGLMAVALLLLYVYGGLTGHWAYGRTISYLVLMLHLALADWVAVLESGKVTLGRFASGARWVRPALGAVLVVWVGWCLIDLRPWLARSLPGRPASYAAHGFLSQHVGQYEVVLSDARTSLVVPMLGGKVVAISHALAFVPDHEQRRQDLRRFFDNATSDAERRALIEQYRVDWVLVNAEAMDLSGATMASLRRLGDVRHADSSRKLTLIRVQRQSARAS